MKKFYIVVANSFLSNVSSTLIWFALSIWVYIETQSVLATSIMSAVYMLSLIITGFIFGPIVDHHRKKIVMITSDIISLILFVLGFIIYSITPYDSFKDPSNLSLWLFIGIVYLGVIISSIRTVALSTLTTIMVEEKVRDKANGLVGSITGIIYIIAPMAGGVLLALSGMYWVLIIALVLRIVTILNLAYIKIPQDIVPKHSKEDDEFREKINFKETFAVIRSVPGLLALFLFNCINNMLGGVFMPLVDPYGLSLMEQQAWGFLSGILSIGFIIGGLVIAKYGLGTNPLKRLFHVNIIMWLVTIFFTIQPSIFLLSLGMFIYFILIPFIEAAEQTIIQKVVPVEKQGRVFGLAHSIEAAAAPFTTLIVGPITQFFFIPFMTNGEGARLIGGWFGTGDGRGIALLFTVAGFIGFVFTLIAMRLKAYKMLSKRYSE